MKVKRKPVIYEAYQVAGMWVVRNTLTNKKDTLTPKQFKEQFEEVRDFEPTPKKKYEPKAYKPLRHIMDPETGETLGFEEVSE